MINRTPQPCAEIIASSLHTFTAHSWKSDSFPAFGSLVTVTSGGRTIYAIVHEITTGSFDSGRMAHPYQKTEAELRHEHPEIFALLQTTFNCVTVAYATEGMLRYQWTPEPPQMHAFVQPATQEQYELLFNSPQYIHVLFGGSHYIPNLDELLLATITDLSQRKLLTTQRLTGFVETFSLLTGNDYRRLKLFLQRVEPHVL